MHILSICLLSVSTNAANEPNTSVSLSELQTKYLRQSANSVEKSLKEAPTSKNPETAISLLHVLDVIYARTNQVDLRAKTQMQIGVAYNRLGMAMKAPDITQTDGTIRVLETLFEETSGAGIPRTPDDEQTRNAYAQKVVHLVLREVGKEDYPVNKGFLCSSLALKASEELELHHGYVRALCRLADLAVKQDLLDCAIGAFLEADLSYTKLTSFSGNLEDFTVYVASLAETNQCLQKTKGIIASAVYQRLVQDTGTQLESNHYHEYIDTAQDCADMFTLIGNKKLQWLSQYMIALGHKELENTDSQIECLLKIVRSFLRADDDDCKELLSDNFVASMLATVTSMANELISESVAPVEKEGKSHASLSSERALEYSHLIMNALRRIGQFLGKKGVHFESLLGVIQLELNRSNRQVATVLDLYEELVDVYPAVMAVLEDEPADQKALNQKVSETSTNIFSLAFEEPLTTTDSLELARKCYQLSSRMLVQLSEAAGSSFRHVMYELMWAELLLRNNLYDEAFQVNERVLAGLERSPGIPVSLAQQRKNISTKGFVYNRLGIIHYKLELGYSSFLSEEVERRMS